MLVSAPLQQMLGEGREPLLKKGMKRPEQIRPLQMLLYGLGYGQEINWDKYRADGGYGRSTTAALAAFKKANSLGEDGTSLDTNILQILLERYKLLPLLRACDKALDDGNWQALFAGEDASANVQQLQKATGRSFTSNKPTETELRQATKELSSKYGNLWKTAAYQDAPAGKAVIVKGSKQDIVNDSWLRVKFSRHKKGVWTLGSDTPLVFINSNKAVLEEKGLTESAIRVITPVSGNEGNLNGINTWDNSYMTFGMFQWTIGQNNAKGELPALVARLKKGAPDAFQEYFGQYGLDTAETSKTTGYFTLNGEKINQSIEKEKFRKGPLWAFRFWRAGTDPRVNTVQLMHAVDRIASFWTNDHYKPLNKFFISDLVTSEYGVCLLLDHHVNRPGHLMSFKYGKKDIVGQAMKAAKLDQTNPSNWGTAEEERLIAAYLPLRYASSMTHGKERAQKITDYLKKGLLSQERHSYQPPAQEGTRSLDSNPANEYSLIHHEHYTDGRQIKPQE